MNRMPTYALQRPAVASSGTFPSNRLEVASDVPFTNSLHLLSFSDGTNFVDTAATNFSRRFYRIVSP